MWQIASELRDPFAVGMGDEQLGVELRTIEGEFFIIVDGVIAKRG
jgi:hypothetical protein